MSENFIKHLVSISGVLICGLAWWGGYVSGGHGWWWSVFSVLVIYVAIFKLLDM